MSKKVILALVLAFLLVISSIPAVYAEEETTMTVWIAKTFNPEADERLAERLRSFADVSDKVSEVNVEIFASTEGQVKWNAAVESGNVPDVSFLDIGVYNSFAELGFLESLNDVVEKIEGNISPIIPNVKENLVVNGDIYAVPLYNPVTMLHYRSDLFEEAGVTPPKTWKEMAEVCEVLKEKIPDAYPFGHAIAACDDSETHNLWIMRCFGGRYWDEEGNVVVNSPETIEAINFILDLYKAGYIPPTTVEWDSSGNNKTFLTGESTMAINVTTLYNSILTGDQADTLGPITNVSQFPLGDYETWMNPGTISLSIFKGVKDLELSKELLVYAMQTEWYNDYMSMNFPVFIPVYTATRDSNIWAEKVGGQSILQSEPSNQGYGYPCKDSAVIRADGYACTNFLLSKTILRVLVDGESVEDSVAQLEQELIDLKQEMIDQVS